MMNRAHNSEEAQKCLEEATRYFDNISVDLIYGVPGMGNEKWKQNIEKALSFGIPHISSYALTVEPKTALKKLIETGKIAEPNDEVAQEHFIILVETLEANGFIHYEVSNFGREDYFSKNNSAYWLGKKYIGIGPSAHSYDGVSRSWNIANNPLFIKSIGAGKLPNEIENLSVSDRYNEYVMTGLRTIWGVSLERIKNEFGQSYLDYLSKQAQKFMDDELLFIENSILKPTKKGKFLIDGIASDLFWVNLE
jgi:oxygen-independent coproporphyrinogen-3 oxidase